MQRFRIITIGLAAMLSFASTALAETKFLDVTVTYRERIALPPDAVVEVELLDTSRADAPSIRMSSQRFRMTAVPQSFQIGYDAALIDDRFTYSVAAKILSGDATLFRSTTATPALTRDAPDAVELILEKMQRTSSANTATNTITGASWVVYEIGGRALVAENPPTLQFDEAGRFGLFAGCNRFAGSAVIDAGTIEFPDNFAGTLMACPEPRENLERDTLDAIGRSVGYVRSGGLLAFTGETGVVTLRLKLQQ